MFSLKERPISPPPGTVNNPNQITGNTLPMTSLPSPLAGNDSPISCNSQANTNMLGNNTQGGVPTGVGPNQVYRPPNAQGNNLLYFY